MFGRPLQLDDTSDLIPSKWVYYRYRNGKRVKVQITKRIDHHIMIAFPKSITKKHGRIDLRDEEAVSQFSGGLGFIKYDPKEMTHPYQVGDRVDIYVAYPPEYRGWFPAKVTRLSAYSTQMCTVYHPDSSRRREYYVDGTNDKEVSRFGKHRKEYKFDKDNTPKSQRKQKRPWKQEKSGMKEMQPQ